MNKNDTISREYLLAEIDDLADEFSETDENGLHNERWCGISDAKRVIINTPFVSDRPQGWISCSKRLPEKEGHYLCSFKKANRIDNIYVDLAYWTGDRWYGYLANEINAWMPLPAPWKGVDDE